MPGARSTRVADRLLKYRVDAAGQAETTPRGPGRRDSGQAGRRGRPGHEVGVPLLQALLGAGTFASCGNRQIGWAFG